MTFYGSFAEIEPSDKVKKPHSENGKKADTKIRQPLNG
jgi:hypothetical protein